MYSFGLGIRLLLVGLSAGDRVRFFLVELEHLVLPAAQASDLSEELVLT